MASHALVTLDTLITSVNGSIQAHELEASKVALDALVGGGATEVVHRKEKLAVLLKSKADTLSALNSSLLQIRQLLNDEEVARLTISVDLDSITTNQYDQTKSKLDQISKVVNSRGTLRSIVESVKLLINECAE